jgi:hypothetical protein
MNATAQKISATPERQVSVNGYIDAITGNRIYGWAWDAQQPKAKIIVRLMAKGETVGIVSADQPREDLKASGIGDGAHAFEIAIPDGISPNEVSVFVVCPDTAATVELAPRAVAGRSEGGDRELRSAVETLTKSHGFMHRKLQAIAAAVAETRRDAGAAAPGPAAATARPDAAPAQNDDKVAPLFRLQILEEALIRLDTLVLEQGTAIDALRHRPADQMPKLLAAAAAVLSAAALVIALVS